MAVVYKNARVASAAADTSNYVTLYTCPANTTAVISCIRVTNTNAANVLFRYAVMGSAGTPSISNGDFLAYDSTAWGNDSFSEVSGITLTAGQFLRVSAGATGVNFFLSVAEYS